MAWLIRGEGRLKHLTHSVLYKGLQVGYNLKVGLELSTED